MRTDDDGDCFSNDTVVEVFDSAGTQLGRADDEFRARAYDCSHLTLDLPAGTFAVCASGNDDPTTAGLSIDVYVRPALHIVEVDYDDDAAEFVEVVAVAETRTTGLAVVAFDNSGFQTEIVSLSVLDDAAVAAGARFVVDESSFVGVDADGIPGSAGSGVALVDVERGIVLDGVRWGGTTKTPVVQRDVVYAVDDVARAAADDTSVTRSLCRADDGAAAVGDFVVCETTPFGANVVAP